MKHLKVNIQDVIDGKDKSPLPLEVIPNYMGINLCSVQSIEWDEFEDGQINKLTINFIPEIEELSICPNCKSEHVFIKRDNPIICYCPACTCSWIDKR